MLRFKPWSIGREAWMLPLCYEPSWVPSLSGSNIFLHFYWSKNSFMCADQIRQCVKYNPLVWCLSGECHRAQKSQHELSLWLVARWAKVSFSIMQLRSHFLLFTFNHFFPNDPRSSERNKKGPEIFRSVPVPTGNWIGDSNQRPSLLKMTFCDQRLKSWLVYLVVVNGSRYLTDLLTRSLEKGRNWLIRCRATSFSK